MNMITHISLPLLFTLLISFFSLTTMAESSHDEHDEHNEGTIITHEMAKRLNISTTIATSGTVKTTQTLYGKTVIDASKISHIQARFTGLITQVNVNIGDTVKAGQALAEIESNESLKRYTIRAPFAGLIEARHANPGELATTNPILTLVGSHALIAELKVFPRQRPAIKMNQSVVIAADTLRMQGTIAHFIHIDEEPNILIARVPLVKTDRAWIPGMLVKGNVVTGEIHAEIIVDNRALQPYENATVVFVKEGTRYEPRPVTLGKTDGTFTQVLSGLHTGDTYVVENSYLIKADIEKSGAAHSH